MKRGPIKGILEKFFEQGMEMACWTFKDPYHAQETPTLIFKGQDVHDTHGRKGKIHGNIETLINKEWLPLPDPLTIDADYEISSLFLGQGKGSLEADKKLMKKYKFKIIYTLDTLNKKYGKNNWTLNKDLTITAPDGSIHRLDDTPITTPPRPYYFHKDNPTRSTIKWSDGITERNRLSKTLLVHVDKIYTLQKGDHLKIYHPNNNSKVWSGIIDFEQNINRMEYPTGTKKGEWERYFNENYPARLIRAR